MIESVIPEDRQGNSLKNEIASIFADVPKGRMILRLGKPFNSDFNLATIVEEGYDAVFIGLGLPKAVSLDSSDKNTGTQWNFSLRPKSRQG